MYTVVVVVGGVRSIGIVIAFALIENLDRLVRTSVFPKLASSFRPSARHHRRSVCVRVLSCS